MNELLKDGVDMNDLLAAPLYVIAEEFKAVFKMANIDLLGALQHIIDGTVINLGD
jgi:hypothetical protein